VPQLSGNARRRVLCQLREFVERQPGLAFPCAEQHVAQYVALPPSRILVRTSPSNSLHRRLPSRRSSFLGWKLFPARVVSSRGFFFIGNIRSPGGPVRVLIISRAGAAGPYLGKGTRFAIRPDKSGATPRRGFLANLLPPQFSTLFHSYLPYSIAIICSLYNNSCTFPLRRPQVTVHKTQPPWEFLLSASRNSLQSYELSRLSHAANLRKEIGALLDQWIEENSAAMLARWLMEQRERPPIVQEPVFPGAPQKDGPHVSDNYFADRAVSPLVNRGPS
jgi:hypothetical protein